MRRPGDATRLALLAIALAANACGPDATKLDLSLFDIAAPVDGVAVDLAARDLPTRADQLPDPPRDLAPPDQAPAADLLAPPDLTIPDLAEPPDLAVPADLAPTLDLAPSPDLLVPDLTVPDLSVPRDLAVAPDVARPPDLVSVPDLAMLAPCANNVRDGNESDVDCGGDSCPACAAGRACAAACDCATKQCFGKVCQPVAPGCNNGMKNGDETDIDCGGSVCGFCAPGKSCRDCRDCINGSCFGGLCGAAPPPGNAVVGSTAPCLIGGNVVYLDGDQGDFIHPGIDTITNAKWFTEALGCGATNHLRVDATPVDRKQGLFWYFTFDTSAVCAPIQVGTYEMAVRAAGLHPGVPAFDVSGDGRGCNQLSGRFQITELSVVGGVLKRFTAAFEQHCENKPPLLRGCVHFEQ